MLLILGCRRGRPPEPVEASTRPCLRNAPVDEIVAWQMVVLKPDAPLRTHRDSPEAFQPGKHTTARILAEEDGWLQLQIGDNMGCYFDPPGLVGLQLQAWAPAEALSPVVTQTTRLEYADGTALTLRAGIALQPSETPGHYWLVDQIATPMLRIPGSIVGQRYQEDLQWYTPADRGLVCDELDGAVRLDGSVLPLLPSDDPWIWAAPGPTDETAVFSSFCASYTAEVPEDAWKEDLSGGVLFGIKAPRAKAGLVLEPGTPMWWPDDRPAGQVRCPEVFSVEVAPSPAGRRCFVRDPATGWRDSLSPRDAGLLTLCFEPPAE